MCQAHMCLLTTVSRSALASGLLDTGLSHLVILPAYPPKAELLVLLINVFNACPHACRPACLTLQLSGRTRWSPGDCSASPQSSCSHTQSARMRTARQQPTSSKPQQQRLPAKHRDLAPQDHQQSQQQQEEDQRCLQQAGRHLWVSRYQPLQQARLQQAPARQPASRCGPAARRAS